MEPLFGFVWATASVLSLVSVAVNLILVVEQCFTLYRVVCLANATADRGEGGACFICHSRGRREV